MTLSQMMPHRFLFRLLIALVAILPSVANAADENFALRAGDTVVLLGDSITAEGTWGKVLETYALLRTGGAAIHFVNAGQGGDTMTGALGRLDRDVFAHQPTAVIVAFGINDIGWGGKADAAHRQAYLDSTRELIRRCQSRHARVYFCSAAITGADPDKSENDFLQQMCDEGMKIATSMGEHSIDVQRTMRDVLRRVRKHNAGEPDKTKHESLHAADTIHLTDLGETAMAFAVIKGLTTGPIASSAAIDYATAATRTVNCALTDIKSASDTLEFTRRDTSLPMNLGLFWMLKGRFIPFDQINQYTLAVTHLPSGDYTITASGRALGTFSSTALAGGVNLASATADPWTPGGPWDAQGWLLHSLTQSRFNLITTRKSTTDYLKQNPNAADIDRLTLDANERIEALQREVATPVPYRFVLTRVKSASRSE